MIWHRLAFPKLFPLPFCISQGCPEEQSQQKKQGEGEKERETETDLSKKIYSKELTCIIMEIDRMS